MYYLLKFSCSKVKSPKRFRHLNFKAMFLVRRLRNEIVEFKTHFSLIENWRDAKSRRISFRKKSTEQIVKEDDLNVFFIQYLFWQRQNSATTKKKCSLLPSVGLRLQDSFYSNTFPNLIE